MAQLRQNYQRIRQLNTEIIVIGPEGPENFRKYWQKKDLTFIGLPDPGHTVLNLYGQEVKIFKLGRMPAQVLIDRSGMLRYAHYGNSMADIPSIEEIIDTIKKTLGG